MVNVACNINSLEYDPDEVEIAARCTPDPNYLKSNPIEAELYHLEEGTARLIRRLLATESPDKKRGIEVRHCVWWDENFGSNGAWDPNGCVLVQTDAEKTKCQCEHFGAIAVVVEYTEEIKIEDDCKIMKIIKFVGGGVSVFALVIFMFAILGSVDAWDMFHILRFQISGTWVLALTSHIVMDIENICDRPGPNLRWGFIMMYFYTSCATWVTLEAHATFKAFTAGIINKRAMIYFPFGYGTPLIPLGFLFLLFDDTLGLDPRCFVGWNLPAKYLYLSYNLSITIVGVVLSVIIIFNMTKPQTKRRNVVTDLKSQAKGTIAACLTKLVFWILAFITYTHNQESDYWDPYCLFAILIGWLGFILFVQLAIFSPKVRRAARRKSQYWVSLVQPGTSWPPKSRLTIFLLGN